MAHKLETHKQAVKLRKRNAKSILKAFIQERINVVENIVSNIKHACEYTKWYETMKRDQAAIDFTIRSERRNEIERRLLEEGWDTRDVYFVLLLTFDALTNKPLSDKVWGRIRPVLVPRLQRIEAIRLEKEFQTILVERKALMVARYATFLCTKKPSEALLYPHADAFYDVSEFEEVLQRPREVTVNLDDFTPAVVGDRFAQFMTDWFLEDPRKKKLISSIPHETISFHRALNKLNPLDVDELDEE
ncbi:hypothetical protein EIP86_009045 [Pleurotus ostreatoroseus]|nr:hypothetical protein EIP86_009045 [Pleurotus ostreatoroseus]